MVDDDDMPPWHKENKGKARDHFSADPPRDEPKPPPPQEPPKAEKPPVLRHHPRSGAMYEDRSGKSATPPRKHTQEEIERWAVWKKREMAKRHERLREEQRLQHEQQKKKTLNAYRDPASSKDAPTLKTLTERHERERKRLDDFITNDEIKTAAEITRSIEKQQIPDTDYLAMIEREHREKDIGRIFDRHAPDIPDGGGDTGRGGRSGGRGI